MSKGDDEVALGDVSLASDPVILNGIDRLLAVQRPAVLAHIRGIRSSAPQAGPAEVIRVLEARYIALVTAAGTAVGASAAVPGISTGVSLALSGVETAAFLEASAMYAQSISEIHGFAVNDPNLARALVMTMILGNAGSALVRKLAPATSGSATPWGLLLSDLPPGAIAKIASEIKSTFLKRFSASQSLKVAGRLIPFGIGAVVGGKGNHSLATQIVQSSRDAFGGTPEVFPSILDKVVPVITATAEGNVEEPTDVPKAAGRRFALPKITITRRDS